MKSFCWADEEIVPWLIRFWPQGVLRAVGRELRRLQKGERPLAYRHLADFGAHVAELKRGALRVVYTTEFEGVVAIVCAFRKDAKRGDAMRPEHERQINRGLNALRLGSGIASQKLPKKLLH